MALENIGIGQVANDGTGDPLRDAFNKVNLNFQFLDGNKVNIEAFTQLANVVGQKLDATGNAVSASKLFNAQMINGVAFDGSKPITIYDNTKLSLETGGTVNGSVNALRNGQVDWNSAGLQSTSNTGDAIIAAHAQGNSAAVLRHVRGQPGLRLEDATGALAPLYASYMGGGASESAVKLTYARQINGVWFDGTADITVYDNTKAPTNNPTFTGRALFASGSAAAPSISFSADGAPDTGIFHVSDGVFGVSANTVEIMRFSVGTTSVKNRLAIEGEAAIDNLRTVNGGYGTFWRQDGNAYYLMVTAQGDPWGPYTEQRPISVALSTGVANINGNATTANYASSAGFATKLGTARQINGVWFDGTANITVYDNTKLPLTGGTLTGQVNVIANGQVGWGTAALQATAQTGDSIIALHTSGATVAALRHQRGGDGVRVEDAGGGLAMVTASRFTGGPADTATKLATARQINGAWFDGTANITIVDDTKLSLSGGLVNGAITARKNNQAAWGEAALQAMSDTGDAVIALHTSGATVAALRHQRGGDGVRVENAGGGLAVVTASRFFGGPADTATKLATARQINGVWFDGTGNITIQDASRLSLLGGVVQGRVIFEKNGQTGWGEAAICSQSTNGDAIISAHAQSGSTAALLRHKPGGNGWRVEDGGTGLAEIAVRGINGGQIGGFRNRLINGNMAINQRNFNGNWGALAQYAYGYDRWQKFDGTSKLQYVEEGYYKPNTLHTLSGQGVTTQQLMSPGGGAWSIYVPFAATNVMLEEGPEASIYEFVPLGIERMRCERYYQIVGCTIRSHATVAGQLFGAALTFRVPMRVIPTAVEVALVSTYNTSSRYGVAIDGIQGRAEIISGGPGDCFALGWSFAMNAEL